MRKYLIIIGVIFVTGCSSIVTNNEFYEPILKDLKNNQYNTAALKISKSDDEYSYKDRVLKHLDKGIIYHYNREFEKSNRELELAEDAIDVLFTKSISKGAASMLLNDNALDYRGEVYENLYINIFKALNYIHLGKFDDAIVEVNRINNKLKELDTMYEEELLNLNSSDDKKFDLPGKKLNFYNDALANYISAILMEADGNTDGKRISIEKLKEAFNTYKDVYYNEIPEIIDSSGNGKMLNIIAFTGLAPVKKAVGARITTFKDFVTISDPTNFYVEPIPVPGVKSGWNFKFAFPNLQRTETKVDRIIIEIDSVYAGELELLEDMNSVAIKTFELEKSMIFFKTIIRALIKGISASALGREVKKEAKGGWGELAAALINIASGISENADLRSWKTMPGYCYIGKFPTDKDICDINISFIDVQGRVLKDVTYENYRVNKRLNLLEEFYLN